MRGFNFSAAKKSVPITLTFFRARVSPNKVHLFQEILKNSRIFCHVHSTRGIAVFQVTPLMEKWELCAGSAMISLRTTTL